MPNRKRERLTLYAVFGMIYMIAATYAMSFFFQNSALGDAYPYTRYDAMIDGNAARPFIYRQLVPLLVRAADKITPSFIRSGVNGAIEDLITGDTYEDTRSYMPWLRRTFPSEATHYRRLVGCVFISMFLAGYMAGIFMLGRALFPQQCAVALFAPIFAVLAFTSFSIPWLYIYDLSCLCLSTACFYFILTQRHRWFMLAFFLSCLNKETAIFSLIFFAIWNVNRLPARRFLGLWVAQCMIFIFVKVIITIEFMGNRGFFLEQNLSRILRHDLLASANIYKISVLLVLWFMLTYGWREKPLFLKRALVLLPLMFLAYVFYGSPGEYRVFFDIHAPLVLLATHTLVVMTGIASSRCFNCLSFQKAPS